MNMNLIYKSSFLVLLGAPIFAVATNQTAICLQNVSSSTLTIGVTASSSCSSDNKYLNAVTAAPGNKWASSCVSCYSSIGWGRHATIYFLIKKGSDIDSETAEVVYSGNGQGYELTPQSASKNFNVSQRRGYLPSNDKTIVLYIKDAK